MLTERERREQIIHDGAHAVAHIDAALEHARGGGTLNAIEHLEKARAALDLCLKVVRRVGVAR